MCIGKITMQWHAQGAVHNVITDHWFVPWAAESYSVSCDHFILSNIAAWACEYARSTVSSCHWDGIMYIWAKQWQNKKSGERGVTAVMGLESLDFFTIPNAKQGALQVASGCSLF